MQDTAVSKYPCPARKRRQLYFSDVTWNMLCDRKEMRKQHREMQRCINIQVLSLVFRAWKNGSDEKQQEAWWNLEIAMLSQQEAVVVEARRKLEKKSFGSARRPTGNSGLTHVWKK